MGSSSVFFLLLAGIVFGLILGAALGWFARAAQFPVATHSPMDVNKLRNELEPALNSSLSHLTKQSIEPLEKAMVNLEQHLHQLDSQRAASLASLNGHLMAMSRTSTRLSDRTEQLVTALRSPNVRGRWGEIQLERIVELGGMVKHVDFNSQVTAQIGGTTVRPDLIINLAGGRSLVVDAKVPFSAYFDALETKDPEEHSAYLRRHAHMVRTHVQALASKSYIEAFSPTPEFVILFTPADPFLDAALSVDPDLLEFAFEKNIVIATPTTLFALLRTIALSWRQEDMSEKAREVQRLGRELFTRLNTMAEHFNKTGKYLDKAVESFNSTLSSLDTRVMVTSRKLAEMDIPARTDKTSPSLDTANSATRRFTESNSTRTDGTSKPSGPSLI
ncbi:MAG: DNA recombination protein RmuC [Corynebacterium sp.]|nr:DNA recombination protein RmuC [Corynebacterium sp.]